MSELQWYVVRAVSGQEKKAKTYLEKEVAQHKLEKYIAEVMVPSEKIFQVRKLKDGKTKKVAVDKTHFPGYLFVNADLTHGEVMHLIKGVPGVIGFLMVDDKDPNSLPKAMRESEVKRMLGRMIDEQAQTVSAESLSFGVGENVKVMDGPFNGFNGVVQEVFEDKKKLNVMVKIFGRNAPVELNFVQVEKV